MRVYRGAPCRLCTARSAGLTAHTGSPHTGVRSRLAVVSRARLHYPLAYARAVSRVVSRVPACAANRHTSHNNNNNNNCQSISKCAREIQRITCQYIGLPPVLDNRNYRC